MIWSKIEKLLCRQVGFDAKIIGIRKIVKAVETRCLICGVNVDNYLQILQKSKQELDELVELLVVPETWFFRDHQIYTAINKYLRYQRLHKSSYGKIRLLSVPCSTGEEPYSLAMTLLDLGLLPNQFHIDGVDISQQALSKAKKAIYSRNSFRSNDLKFQKRYFISTEQGYQLSENVKKTVTFTQANLLDANLLSNRINYDIIFCRNVLIYFDIPAREKALKNLHRLLKNQGLLLVGASETGELANLGLEIIRLHGVFVGQKQRENPATNKNPKNPPANSSEYVISPPQVLGDSYQIHQPQTPTIPEKGRIIQQLPTIQKSQLDSIRNLADQGKLKAAISQCQNYIYQNSTSAEAYLLLGEIYQAQGVELAAEECFQKAVYLDPKNSQALIHLALLKEQQGDREKANILRQRWQRLQKL
ncbi:methyltransferase domain-containing protein [Sphaerospermopsis aphanizomenoides BCCUSP55]|uniref:CheR family methyltransferase n=1 Tax=Sphaerospermopsis aphanizomenoides TaxID=459663 RepID=UPI0019062B9E|nr:protein-glutamate O-methyltransferase CheR [Sphaerospermopsis aphanizomenoides]MBK1988792.1 methyltransferase domain-containing protein [Sphaerospermopsis aphanizomenoides BCCUSP55]